MDKHFLTLATVVALGLAACSDSSYVEPAPVVAADDNTVPASATATPEAYTAYVGSRVASETADPLDVEKVVPPTSETTEPADLS